jgi:N-dimethylarginine dimethylaminohydrolase
MMSLQHPDSSSGNTIFKLFLPIFARFFTFHLKLYITMKTTCQSEIGALHTIVIKHSKDAFVNKKTIDKEWQMLSFTGRPILARSTAEFNEFENIIKRTGATVLYLPHNDKVTMDSLYCRDAAIATDAGMILCNMGKERRKSEPLVQKQFFLEHNIPILGSIKGKGTVEGGDVAWLDEKTLVVGHSYRTNEEGIKQLTKLLKPLGVSILRVDLPHYKGPSDVFHLMSIFSPIDTDLAVVYSPLMPIVFRNELINRGYTLVEVPPEEYEMACNVLALAPRKCLMVNGYPKTKKALEAAGCKVFTFNGAEISLKGGGGPTCLTRPIWRTV